MNKRVTVHVGLDVREESIEIALADGTSGGEVGHCGRIGGDPASLDRAVRRLVGTGRSLIFTYEAGPCGYAIYRHLSALGPAHRNQHVDTPLHLSIARTTSVAKASVIAGTATMMSTAEPMILPRVRCIGRLART